jgi:hypothetical protein
MAPSFWTLLDKQVAQVTCLLRQMRDTIEDIEDARTIGACKAGEQACICKGNCDAGGCLSCALLGIDSSARLLAESESWA